MSAETRRNRAQGISTRAIHVGYDPAEHQGALTPPIFMTSTYAFETMDEAGALFRGEKPGYVYGRTKNPTQTVLEERVASLEGAEAGMTAASGMAAISSIMLTLLSPGDEAVIDHTLYGNSYALFTQGLTRLGIKVRPVDFTVDGALADALTERTKIVYFETPANPNLRVIDIAEVARLARRSGALTVVDNTFATPVLQRPLELGADLVLHSGTKYLGGHGDLLAGVVVGSNDLIKQIRQTGLRWMTGATLSPFNCFLMLRGLKTLEVRLERHCASALAVARELERHPKVARVDYPGLASFAQHEIAMRQMSGKGGGLVSLEIDGGIEAGVAFMDRLRLISRAVSLGDAETLIQHPASMTHAIVPREDRLAHGIGDGLLRLSVGLENVEDILDDLDHALNAI